VKAAAFVIHQLLIPGVGHHVIGRTLRGLPWVALTVVAASSGTVSGPARDLH
jgi:hypothetical protein